MATTYKPERDAFSRLDRRHGVHGWATAIGAAAALAGGAISASGAHSAANTQADSAAKGIEEQRRQYDLTRSDLAPWRKSGGNALSELDRLLGFDTGVQIAPMSYAAFKKYREDQGGTYKTPAQLAALDAAYKRHVDLQKSKKAAHQAQDARIRGSDEFGYLNKPFTEEDFHTDPGYEFRLGEGSKAVENSAASRGMQLSGATLKALQRYNQGFASNEYSNAFNRDNTEKVRTFNNLAAVSGIGQNATNTTAQAGSNAAGNITDLITGQGNANAAGQVAGYNALGQGITGAYDAYNYANLMKRLFPSSSSSSYSGSNNLGSTQAGYGRQYGFGVA